MLAFGRCSSARVVVCAMALGCLAINGAALAYEPDASAPRSSIPSDAQWRWADIFPSDTAWEQELKAVETDIPTLARFEGHLGDSPATLKEAQTAVYNLLDRFTKVGTYAQLRFDIDQGENTPRTNVGRVAQLGPAFGQAVSYMEPELLQIPRAKIEGWMAADPELKEWSYYFNEMWRQQEHTLSADGERLMAITGRMAATPSDAHEALLGVDIEFPKVVSSKNETLNLSLNSFGTYRAHVDPQVRTQTRDAFFGTLRSYENTFAVLLDGEVKNHIANKEARNYGSCREAALSPDNITTQTYDNLVQTVRQNLPRTLHKYVELRRKVLGLDGPLTFPNLYNPLLPSTEVPYTYDEGIKLVAEGLAPLGKAYVQQASIGMDPKNGWTDVYPNEDKRSGAYSNGSVAYDIHPFVLQNFDNTLYAVYTTAHEYGHAMHSFYSSSTQPRQYRGYTTFLAEIASTCNESLVTNFLLKKYKDDVDMTLMLLNQRLESMRLTIFRQTLFADFEAQFHAHAEAGNPLTAEWLNAKYKELITTYYGPGFQMAENDECEWMFIPHFYRDFYVFSYATGLTSGLALAEEISTKGQKSADRYIDNMLKAGSNAPPLDILRNAGVDLETPAPIQSAMDLFARTVAEFEKTWEKKQAMEQKSKKS
jgi:oligoendopeptidase F